MSIISTIRRWVAAMYDKLIGKAHEDFGVQPVSSAEMEDVINTCASVYAGNPSWVNSADHIKTINFAKAVCSETARLATLAIHITVDGSARAKWIQAQVDRMYFQLRHWVEYGCAYGTITIKPNGEYVDIYTPDQFAVTDVDGDRITGCIFVNRATQDDRYYTRLEYHRFEDDVYRISNICYVSNDRDDDGHRVAIESTPWEGLQEETAIQGMEQPLFGVFKTPEANNVDIDSTLGLPVFYGALSELQDLDIAYSRNAKEIFDSKRTVLLDSDRLLPSGMPVHNVLSGFQYRVEDMGLPDYVKSVYGDGQESFYQEINPTLNTEMRITGINNLLSQIGYKCGFSNGYFVLDEKTGMVTATQVEADDRRTIQFIKDVRDKLEDCLNGLVYALSIMADLYNLSPAGTYEITYDFGDITYSREEDRARWWQYVQSNKVPAWYFFVKFEGMSEKDARAMVEEATPAMPTLFGEE